MKIVVIGGSSLTGSKLVTKLHERDARLAETRFETWLTQPAAKSAAGIH